MPLVVVDAADSTATPCRTIEQTFNSLEVACPMAASQKPHAIEFVARFSGGHDDTLVTIAPRVGERDAPCDAGSKLRSFGEDGDLALTCTVTRKPGDAPAELAVLIKWSHAEYTEYAVAAKPVP
ncbi:MAG: hypothetical protein EOP08_11300 [Proteobacteria bacterium]|nr:MAG: hypothetical protein EOP08_11300 [Pseudomonadota bacterium]